jgi:hypothetical protein
MIRTTSKILFAALLSLPLIACEAEVGSKEWCADIKAKSKGDVTAKEAASFAKHCIFK